MEKLISRGIWCGYILIAAVGCGSSGGSDLESMPETELLSDVLTQPAQALPAAAVSQGGVAADGNTGTGVAAAPVARPAENAAVPPGSRPASERPALRSDPNTYLGAIAAANRNIRTRLDDLPWKKSVELYQAEKGYKPRNTKDFLERVRSEGTPLPEIPPGYTYLYVPDEGQFGELYQVPLEDAPKDEPPGR
jgi:hypothetical protein